MRHSAEMGKTSLHTCRLLSVLLLFFFSVLYQEARARNLTGMKRTPLLRLQLSVIDQANKLTHNNNS